ncbi:MAG TPA: bifunctional riboflavin kinase/FAD synthetase [Symbiobacteriaceae bacterium]|nr:bifunctional riboflavin kinase/FAD synthetase [Symbiobacteriaceae bacterium]
MQLIADLDAVPSHLQGTVVAIGKWDGVHVGHQAIIRALVAEARSGGAQSVVMGFHPLPMAVLRPNEAPPMIQTLAERAEFLAAMGVDLHLALPFDLDFAAMEPEDYIQQVLVERLRPRAVLVGFNHTFGRGGRGTVGLLKQQLGAQGIAVRIFDPVRVAGESVSSTEVRFHASQGDMAHCKHLLGRPLSITGQVQHGDKRGRAIGFPTANIALGERRQLPASGVYVARVTLLDGESCMMPPCEVRYRTGSVYGGMLNLGTRPTVHGSDLRCEVHLFDFQGDLYGRELRVEFLHRLRGEKAFGSLDGLRAQLAIDEAAARAFLAGGDPSKVEG